MNALQRGVRARVTLLRRLRRDESGAAAVLIALLGVLLMGFAALAIDYGHAESERAKAQVAADAAALAIAEDCAAGRTTRCAPGGPGAQLATLNGAGSATITVAAAPARTVKATTSIEVKHWFAPIIGINSSTVQGAATARWTPPSTTGGAVTGANVTPFLMESCLVPSGFAPVKVTLSFSAYSSSCESILSPARQVVRVGDSCTKIPLATGAERRDQVIPWFWGGCPLPAGPIVVALWDRYDYTFFGSDSYRVSAFAIFDPDPDRVTSSGVTGTFFPLDPNHPDIVRGVGTTVPGTVSLIE